MKLSNFLENKSRFLSLVLRHAPEKANITLDEEGFTDVKELCLQLKISEKELEDIVVSNDKKRFAYNEDKTLIRASQGHSVKAVQVTLIKVEIPPATLYHGTKDGFLTSIMSEGLVKGTRHHVHLSDNEATAKNVADRRKGKSVILSIDAMHMRADNIKFYQSENGVYLVDYVPKKYITVLKDK